MSRKTGKTSSKTRGRHLSYLNKWARCAYLTRNTIISKKYKNKKISKKEGFLKPMSYIQVQALKTL